MKKTLVAMAALAATGAFAQVTISGLMNGGITYNSAAAPGASNIGASAGNNNRIIFSVSEDLGGGLTAVGTAQLRFNPFTGNAETSTSGAGTSTARPLFQGESRIGLRGGFGQILLGRGLTALQAPNGGIIDPWGVSTVAGSVYAPGFNSGYAAGEEGRLEGLFYTSPNFGGLTVAVSYSPATAATGAAVTPPTFAAGYGSNAYSTALTYSAGPLNAVIGYESNKSSDTLMNVGANYDMGAAKLYVGYGQVKGGTAAQRQTAAATAGAGDYPGAANAIYGGTVTNGPIAVGTTNTVWSVGAAIPMGKMTFRAGYSNFGSDIANASRDSKIGLGVQYDLSKRTMVYSDVATTTRNNNAAGAIAAVNKDTVTAFDFGLQHSF